MIDRLVVKNFKGLVHLEIEPFRRITVLGGRNNVGKSTVLEALFMIHDKKDPHALLKHLGFRGVEQVLALAGSIFSSSFSNFDLDRAIELEVAAAGRLERMVIQGTGARSSVGDLRLVETAAGPSSHPPSFASSSESHVEAPDICMTHYVDGKEAATSHVTVDHQGIHRDLTGQLDDSPTAVLVGARSRSSPGEDANRFAEIEIRGENELLLRVLRTIEPRIEDLSSVSSNNHSALYADIGLPQKIPMKLLGDGTCRLLSILLAMSKARNGGVVLIDEIDTGFHHTVLPGVWKALRLGAETFDVQLIATTHSYGCLHAAIQGLEFENLSGPDFTYFRLEPDGASTRAVNYPFDELREAIEAELEVR